MLSWWTSNSFLLSVVLFVCPWATIAQEDNHHFSWANLVVDVTGNGKVPKYTFWLASNPASAYKVMFQQLFEAQQQGSTWQKAPATTLALPSLDWSFLPGSNFTNGLVFNITGKPKHSGDPKQDRFDYITFRNNLTSVTVCVNTSSILVCRIDAFLKFDVIISNYRWISAPPNSLVLFFKFTPSDNDNTQATTVGVNKFRTGDAYFNLSNVAHGLLNPNETIQVRSVFKENGVWIIYERFNGPDGLVNDPAFNIVPSQPVGGDGDGNNNTVIIAVSVTAAVCLLGVLLVAALMGFVLFKRQRAQYYTPINAN